MASATVGMVGSPLTRKLAEIMEAVKRVPKRGRNAFHGYQYATEADIADVVREELSSRQVVLYSAIDAVETRVDTGESGKPSNFVTVSMTFTIIDGESGEERAFKWAGAGQDRGEKGLYKAITGAEKYFLLKLFLIPTGDDPEDDSQDAKHPPAKATAAQLPAVKPASTLTLTEAQQTRLKALMKEHGVKALAVKTMIEQAYPIKTAADIRQTSYDDICAFVVAGGGDAHE